MLILPNAMETTLHHQLKMLYADDHSGQEIQLGKYRIDVVRGDVLVEIQLGSIGAIRDKLQKLVADYFVLVVKPVIARKTLIKLDGPNGAEISRRQSPKKRDIFSLFDELVYCTRLFPHPNLCIDVPIIEMEETRYPGHGRRRRRRDSDFAIQDKKLLEIQRVERVATASDLLRLIPESLPAIFHTGHLAEATGQKREVARQMAYCFRKMNIAKVVGKEGNALLYQLCSLDSFPASNHVKALGAVGLSEWMSL